MRHPASGPFVPPSAPQARPGGALRMSRLLGIALILLAACVAAIVAHVGIDVAGDYVLSHDSYDFVPHGSRAVVMFGAIVVGLTVLAHLLGAACEDARGNSSLAYTLAALARRSPALLIGQIIVLTLLVLCAMEWVDVIAGGQHVEDLGDLLGGSVALGLTFTFVCGLLAGMGIRALIAWLGTSRRLLVAALVAFLRVERTRPVARPIASRGARAAQTCVAAALARRGAKRGPPPGLRVRSALA